MREAVGRHWALGAWLGAACVLFPTWAYIPILTWWLLRCRMASLLSPLVLMLLTASYAWWTLPINQLSGTAHFVVERVEDSSRPRAWGRCVSPEGSTTAWVSGLPSPVRGSHWLLHPSPKKARYVNAEWVDDSQHWRGPWKSTYYDWMRESMAPYPRPASLYAAMATGEIEEEALRPLLGRFGMSHLLALSGLHVTLVLATLGRILQWGGLYGRLLLLIQALCLCGYIFLVGPYPSALRAGGMAAMAMVGESLGRRTSATHTLGCTVALLILLQPSLSGHFGFQLSCAATWGLLCYAQPLTKWLGIASAPQSKKEKLLHFVVRTLATNLAVLPLTLPLLLLRFHEFNFTGILVNGVLAPLLSYGFALSLFIPIFGRLLGVPLGYASEWLLKAIELPWWCDLWSLPCELSTTTCILCTSIMGILLDRPLEVIAWYRERIGRWLHWRWNRGESQSRIRSSAPGLSWGVTPSRPPR